MSFKAMVLGTKILYDMIGMESNTDLVEWANSYTDDMNQLFDEVDEVNRMDGWSLTGKNTFVEEIVDGAYERSFHQ